MPVARTPPPEPALFDWCDGLVTSAKAGNIQSTPPAVLLRRSHRGRRLSSGTTQTSALQRRSHGDGDARPRLSGGTACGSSAPSTTPPPCRAGPVREHLQAARGRRGFGCDGKWLRDERGLRPRRRRSLGLHVHLRRHGERRLGAGHLPDVRRPHDPQPLHGISAEGQLLPSTTAPSCSSRAPTEKYLYGVTGLHRTLDLVPAPTTP